MIIKSIEKSFLSKGTFGQTPGVVQTLSMPFQALSWSYRQAILKFRLPILQDPYQTFNHEVLLYNLNQVCLQYHGVIWLMQLALLQNIIYKTFSTIVIDTYEP